MEIDQIAAWLRPFGEFDVERLKQTLIYVNLLMKWNARVNLTAVRDPTAIVQRHFGESFFAANHLLAADATESVIDLGSGAGFPGLPIAMLRPKAKVTLIESNGKKAAFLNEMVRTLKLSNAVVFNQRAEVYSGTSHLVTMRAVESFSKAGLLALKLVSAGGRLALMIGASQIPEARALDSHIEWHEPIAVPGGHSRVLLAGTKPITVE